MMSAILGLFTRHLVTKFVALLLAIVLFVVTQQGISDTQLIKQIVITFELSPEASTTWVLLEKRVILKNMTVQGLRDTLTREIAGLRGLDFQKKIVIDEDFLRRHSTDRQIVLDGAFCESEEIPWKLERDFRLVVPEPQKLQIARRVNRTFRPMLTEKMQAMLDLPEDFRFLGPGGAVRPPIRWVGETVIAVSGPESALPPANEDDSVLPLYITIKPLTEMLQGKVTLAEARSPLPIDGIDWRESKFDIGMLQHIVIERPNVGRLALKNEISVSCDLEERRKSIKLKLPILFVTNAGSLSRADLVDNKKFDFNGAEGIWGQGFRHDDKWEFVDEFPLEVAETWDSDSKLDELSTFLAVRIDLTNVEERGETVIVPLEIIRLKGPADLGDTVRIRRDDKNDPPALQFNKKKPS